MGPRARPPPGRGTLGAADATRARPSRAAASGRRKGQEAALARARAKGFVWVSRVPRRAFPSLSRRPGGEAAPDCGGG